MDKPTVSPSRLAHYLRCPRAFELSREEDANIGKGTEDAMREGNLFEGYVFGFKPNQDETALIGRKKAETVETIKGQAEYIKPIFAEGQPYQFLKYETDRFTVRGEADYIGTLNEENLHEISLNYEKSEPIGKCIADLKYTGDISRVWDFKESKEDYLQAIFYPYMLWKNTGEILPFVYIVTDSRYKYPIVRVVKMTVTEKDFTDFVEPLLKRVASDFWFQPNPSKETCLGGYGQSQCWFLEYCEWGRRVVGGFREFEFKSLYQNNEQ